MASPVESGVSRGFAPESVPGHYGVDFDVAAGTLVRPAASGTVTFAGFVAGMLSVTVNHGGGLRTSYSFLERIDASVGTRVDTEAVIGLSGIHYGRSSLHWSLRSFSTYLDPVPWLRCSVPAGALELRSARSPLGTVVYPSNRATRHLRRHI